MATLAQIESEIRTYHGITDPAAWDEGPPMPVAQRPSVVSVRYSTTTIDAAHTGTTISKSISVQHLNGVGGTETAWVESPIAPSALHTAALAWISQQLAADTWTTCRIIREDAVCVEVEGVKAGLTTRATLRLVDGEIVDEPVDAPIV